MPQINELPNEVLQTMTRSQGIDLARVEPEAKDAIQPSTGGAPANPNFEQLRKINRQMEAENGPIKRFNILLARREKFNDNVNRLNQSQADDMLKQRAQSNRDLLSKMFLGG